MLFALLATAFPVALIALAGGRSAGLGRLRLPLIVLVLFLEGCVIAMLALRGNADAPWLGGLPLAATIQVYGIFLLPLPLVALTYALTFDRLGLRRQDLEELRRRFASPETED